MRSLAHALAVIQRCRYHFPVERTASGAVEGRSAWRPHLCHEQRKVDGPSAEPLHEKSLVSPSARTPTASTSPPIREPNEPCSCQDSCQRRSPADSTLGRPEGCSRSCPRIRVRLLLATRSQLEHPRLLKDQSAPQKVLSSRTFAKSLLIDSCLG